MKKNLALVLSVVMLLGSLFGVMSMAEATETPEIPAPPAEETPAVEYAPEVAYSNINYSDKMYMSFAVNAPASLAEGESVKLLLWNSFERGGVFNYANEYKLAIDAEAETVKIGEADYLVFKYDALSAADMATTVYVRPVVVSADKATAYGPVVEYSVLEYIAAAKGELEGIAGLEDPEYIGVLDSMIEFGALAQKYLLEEEPEFYVNEKLSKIFMTPVLGGAAKDKTLAGFFKYEEGGLLTLTFPFYDTYRVASVTDKDGAAIVDADEEEDGFQIAAADADIEITVNYSALALFDADVSVNKENVSLNSSDNTPGGAYGYYDAGIGGFSFNTSGGYTWKSYCYNSLDVTDDPYNEGEKTFRWVCSNTSALQLGDSKTNFNGSYRLSTNAAFGDTIAPVITIELVLGGTENSADVNLGNFRIRGGSSSDLLIPFKIVGGKVYIYTANDKNSIEALSVPIPKDGYAKYAIVIDFANEVISGYVEGEDGKMVKEVESREPYCAGTNVTTMGWLNWAKTNHQKWEWHGGSNGLTAEEKALIGDSAAPNLEKLAEIVTAKNSVLIKDLNVVFGNTAEQ